MKTFNYVHLYCWSLRSRIIWITIANRTFRNVWNHDSSRKYTKYPQIMCETRILNRPADTLVVHSFNFSHLVVLCNTSTIPSVSIYLTVDMINPNLKIIFGWKIEKRSRINFGLQFSIYSVCHHKLKTYFLNCVIIPRIFINEVLCKYRVSFQNV